MKSKRVNLPYYLFSQGNPSQAISKSLLVSEVPEIYTNNQSCNAEFDLVDSSSGSTTFSYILHEIIHTTLVLTLTEGELGTISKYSSRGITLGIRPISGGGLLNLPVYSKTNKQKHRWWSLENSPLYTLTKLRKFSQTPSRTVLSSSLQIGWIIIMEELIVQFYTSAYLLLLLL